MGKREPVRTWLMVTLALLAIPACSRQEPDAEPLSIPGEEIISGEAGAPAQAAPGAGARPVINLGEAPWDREEKLRRFYDRFLRYLSRRLNAEVVLNITPDYQTLLRDLVSGRIQVASLTPMAYAEALASARGHFRYLATLKWHDSSMYRGYVFTRRESPIGSLEGMRGRTIAFNDITSASGYLYPVSLFLQRGIDPETFFSRVFFLGSHIKVTEAVHQGSVDLGATYDRNYEEYQRQHGTPFRVVLETEPIPFGSFVVCNRFPDDLFRRLQAALVELDRSTRLEDGKPVLIDDYFLSGFQVVDEKAYAPLERTYRLIAEYRRRQGGSGRP